MSSITNRRLAAVMFTDIVGFSNIMSADESMALEVLDLKVKMLNPILKKHEGELIKNMGDGSLSCFESAVNAVKCAQSLIELIEKEQSFNVRVGIHLGEVVYRDKDVFGDGVNIASRLENLAEPGSILISKDVNDQLSNHTGFQTKSLGTHSIKGIGRVLEIFTLTEKSDPKGGGYLVEKVVDVKERPNSIPSVAVIPIINKGPEEDDFYTYSISYDMISDMSSLGKLRVASMNTVEKADYKTLTPDRLADELSVRYIVNGSFWKRDKLFQLSIELYDTEDKNVLWSDHWYENWDNLSSIKDKLTEGILTVLKVDENQDLGISTNISTKTEAYEMYLKGKFLYRTRQSLDDRAKARSLFEKAVKLDPNLIKAKVILGETYYVDGDFEKAINIYKECIKSARSLDRKKEESRCLHGIGNTLSEQGHFKKALSYQEKALKIREEIDDVKGIAFCLNSIGNLYGFLNDLEESRLHLVRALEIRKVLGNKRLIAITQGNLGHIYWRMEDYDKAKELGEASYNLRKEVEDWHGVGVALTNLGNIHFNQGDYDTAISMYNESADYKEKMGDRLGYGTTINNIGCVYYKNRDLDKAISYFEKALKVRKSLDVKVGMCETLEHLAQTHYEKKEPHIALQYLHDSLDQHNQLGNMDKVVHLKKEISNMQELVKGGIE